MHVVGEQAHPLTIPEENLHQIAPSASEDEQVAAERVLSEHLLHLPRKAVEAAPHIGGPRGQPDPCAARQRDHSRSAARMRRSARASTC